MHSGHKHITVFNAGLSSEQQNQICTQLWTHLSCSVTEFTKESNADINVIFGDEIYPEDYKLIAVKYNMTLNFVDQEVHEDFSLTSWADINFYVWPLRGDHPDIHSVYTMIKLALNQPKEKSESFNELIRSFENFNWSDLPLSPPDYEIQPSDSIAKILELGLSLLKLEIITRESKN